MTALLPLLLLLLALALHPEHCHATPPFTHSRMLLEDTPPQRLSATPSLTSTLTCTMSATESCPITHMPRDVTTQVFPGTHSGTHSLTRCILSDSTPYSFQVVPGDPSKLLFYFQGGE